MERVELLRAFLADRDTPCPRCGYNLRGTVSTKCPECGYVLRLGLVEVEHRNVFWLTTLVGVCLALGYSLGRNILFLYLSVRAGASMWALPGNAVFAAHSVAFGITAVLVVLGHRLFTRLPRVIQACLAVLLTVSGVWSLFIFYYFF